MAEKQPQIDRLPPQDLTAERAVLCSMLIEQEAVGKALEILQPEDFYRRGHSEIYRTMVTLFSRTEPIDMLTVADELSRQNLLEEVGGNYYLTELSNAIPSAANVEYHARIVLEKALFRKLISISTEISQMAYESTEKATDLIDMAEQKIFSLSERGLRKGFQHIEPVLKETFATIENYHHQKGAVNGVPSGFHALDDKTSGFQNSDLVILAARPSMGKTALCLNMARNAAVDHGIGVGIFSLEMASYQLALRLLTAEAKVDAHLVRTGKLPKDDWKRLSIAAGRLSNAKIFIDDTPGISILEIRAKARRLMAEHRIGMIIVDYLQLVHGPNSESRQQEISRISQSLKALAKELNIPVIALSQLSRAVESRTDKRPMLSDLRESGAIEQDADVVMFVYREDFYDQSQDDAIAEIIIGKQRNGPIGTVDLKFLKQFVLFTNLTRQEGDMYFGNNAQPF
ncbi:MAG: replicative DNA helicase [Deferribacteres bacterium]|nr:replicative DNA helicase [candidate division KSB1 bacterium]MCB9501486.1 replicative DNA helicase [Deferribacteres bacterium]